MTDQLAEIAGSYKANDIRQLMLMTELGYTEIQNAQKDAELLACYASFACQIAVSIRINTDIDICTLSSPIEKPPLPVTHPLMKAIRLLDSYIGDCLKSIALFGEKNTREVKIERGAALMRLQTAAIWKSYLFTRNTEPKNWSEYSAHALSALKTLSEAKHALVMKFVREEPEDDPVRNSVRDIDWPPRAAIELYSQHTDLIEDKIVGGAALKKGDMETIKQVAHRNWLRERRALDQSPRATAKEITALASEINTVDDVKNAYNALSRGNFSDVVAAAVRANNLPQQDASFALHLREWVRCEADLRLSFPEWLESEGLERFLSLNRQWVTGGADPGMSFEQWLASAEVPTR